MMTSKGHFEINRPLVGVLGFIERLREKSSIFALKNGTYFSDFNYILNEPVLNHTRLVNFNEITHFEKNWNIHFCHPLSPNQAKARTTDTQWELFFKNLKLLGLGRHFWIFSAGLHISTHFGTESSLSMLSIIQPLFLQKTKPLYSHLKCLLFGIAIWIWATKN